MPKPIQGRTGHDVGCKALEHCTTLATSRPTPILRYNNKTKRPTQCPTTGETRVAGGSSFFTVNLRDRGSDLLVTHIDLLRAAIRRVRHLMPFKIDAWVVLPDHTHAVWTLPPDDANFSHRWQAIKMAFSKGIDPPETLSISRQIRGERGLWQRRFWEHTIRDDQDYAAHLDYVHFNPVKHGLVPTPASWPYSTFHRAVANGHYPASWSAADVDDSNKGERATT